MNESSITLQPGTVIIKDRPANTKSSWLWFSQCDQTLVAYTIVEIEPLLKEIDRAVNAGMYVAGFLSYEASAAFDFAFQVKTDLSNNSTNDANAINQSLPLAWFTVYSNPPRRIHELPILDEFQLNDLHWKITESKESYYQKINQILGHIAVGESYQVNYTVKLTSKFEQIKPWQLFLDLTAAQPLNYAAYVCLENFTIVSASPELFFRLDNNRIVCKPMKGTASRGFDLATDQDLAAKLRQSAKERAENSMITDMVRNDLGKIAKFKTVKVSKLFELEAHPTVWQMTSTVEAETSADISSIFNALYPPASITGAPKIKTMKLIESLELQKRGIYTGSIGYIAPNRKAQFNVAIRTVLVNHSMSIAEYGVGSGIVIDSQPKLEYKEIEAKSNLLFSPPASTQLLETILWRPNQGWFLIELHLSRLCHSAKALQFDFIQFDSTQFDSTQFDSKVLTLLNASVSTAQTSQRVRLMVSRDGSIQVETNSLVAMPNRIKLCLAKEPVNSNSIWLRHKTTWRNVYQEAGKGIINNKIDDVILFNERREITETTIANIAVKLNGKWCTPPLLSGLLPGVYRQYLLNRGKLIERVISIDDLLLANRQNTRSSMIAIFNSVRGWRRAELLIDPIF